MPALEEDLATLLASLRPQIVALSRRLVAMLGVHPGLSGKVKFRWRSVNLHHNVAGHVCAIFPHQDRVALHFEHGRLLQDNDGLLRGNLKKGAFIRFRQGDAIEEDAIGVLLSEAIALKA
jgi:hypothetical protein